MKKKLVVDIRLSKEDISFRRDVRSLDQLIGLVQVLTEDDEMTVRYVDFEPSDPIVDVMK